MTTQRESETHSFTMYTGYVALTRSGPYVDLEATSAVTMTRGDVRELRDALSRLLDAMEET